MYYNMVQLIEQYKMYHHTIRQLSRQRQILSGTDMHNRLVIAGRFVWEKLTCVPSKGIHCMDVCCLRLVIWSGVEDLQEVKKILVILSQKISSLQSVWIAIHFRSRIIKMRSYRSNTKKSCSNWTRCHNMLIHFSPQIS